MRTEYAKPAQAVAAITTAEAAQAQIPVLAGVTSSVDVRGKFDTAGTVCLKPLLIKKKMNH